MTTAAATVLGFLFLVAAGLISPSGAEIWATRIRSDAREIIPLSEFGFTRTGRLELNASGVVVRSSHHKRSGDSPLGFLLATSDAWSHVRERCVLNSSRVKTVLAFNAGTNHSALGVAFNQTDPGDYTLLFANCLWGSEVSMDIRFSTYNLDAKTGKRDYLSAGSTTLPQIYLFFFLVHAVLCGVWVSILYKKRLTAFRIHYFMLAVIVLKALNLLCEAEEKSYIKRTGRGHGWDVLFYIFSFLKGITLFTLLVLIGTGWSFLKPYLQSREKKVLMVVIPLQVVANIVQVAMDETAAGTPERFSWKQAFVLVDVVCCCAVLFPIIWSIRNLKQAARTDGKAAVNLMKLTLFKQYYIVVICYLYFTRIVVYGLSAIVSYRYSWTGAVVKELATLAFYIFTGYKFKPEPHNPYFVVDDEEEGVALEALKNDDFEI